MCQKKGVVGIFSSEHASCYEWLSDFILDSSLVRDVRHVYISNKSWNLKQEISQCTFGILYHTKKRGRINVTDVTDSLYDVELRALSEILGRNNVIVVIDDVEDGSDDEKNRILKSQPSIIELALDLVLFREDENIMLTNLVKQAGMGRKHEQIRSIIKAHNRRLRVTECWKWKWLFLAPLLIGLALTGLGFMIYRAHMDLQLSNTTYPP
ncbi:uncharacterized protein ACMZJ9_010471 [Mantella aurantiaca]